MIRLITATPGSGKTCIVVEWLLREIDKGFYKSYYCNINGLQVCGVRPLLDDWRTVPDDKKPALIIVDEAQYHDEFMKETTKSNEIGKALSTHRHYGVDFWLITQSPKLLNSYVLENTGEHVHLYRPRKKKTVTVYWWSYAVTNLVKSNFKLADDERKWRLNPLMFQYYKSTVAVTDGETRTSHRTVSSLITAAAMLLVIAYFVNGGVKAFEQSQHDNKDTVLAVDKEKLPATTDIEEPNGVDAPVKVDESKRVASVFLSETTCRAYNGLGDLLEIEPSICIDLANNPIKLKSGDPAIKNERLQALNYKDAASTSNILASKVTLN